MRTLLLLLISSLCLGASALAACQPSIRFTYTDNFEDERAGADPSHWLERYARGGDRVAPLDRWRVAADAGNRIYASDGAPGSAWTWLHVFCRDGVFRGRLRVTAATGTLSIVGRMNSSHAWVRCDYDAASGAWTLRQQREKPLADALGQKMEHANRARADATADARNLAKAVRHLEGWHAFALTCADNRITFSIDGQELLAATTTHLTYGRFGVVADGVALALDDIAYRGREGRVQDGVQQFDSHDDLADRSSQGVTARLAGGPVVLKLGDLWLRSEVGIAWTAIPSADSVRATAWDCLTALPDGTLLGVGGDMERWKGEPGQSWRAGKLALHSRDQGATWTRMGGMSISADECVVMPDKLVHLRDGRLLFSHYAPAEPDKVTDQAYPVNKPPYPKAKSTGRDLVTTVSRDDGATWQPFLRLPDTDDGHTFNEHDIIQLSDGRLRLAARSTRGHLYTRALRDDGKALGPWLPLKQLVSPMCSYQIRTDPEDARTHYVFWCYNEPQHETDTDDGVDWVMPRTRMSLARSRDDLATWEFLCDVDDWDYPGDRFPSHDARYLNHSLLVDRDALYLITRRSNPYDDRGDKPFRHTEDKKIVSTSALVTRIEKRALQPYPAWPPLHYANKGIIPPDP